MLKNRKTIVPFVQWTPKPKEPKLVLVVGDSWNERPHWEALDASLASAGPHRRQVYQPNLSQR
jgi:hypothetical protein